MEIGAWLGEWTRLPSVGAAAEAVSGLLGGAQAWVELLPEGRGSHPLPDAPVTLLPPEGGQNGSLGSPAWVIRRQQQDARVLLWTPIVAGGVHRGFVAAAAAPEHWKERGGHRTEGTLLVVALHLSHLLLERELTQKVQGRDEFLAIAGHEIKTPITAIYGIAQLQERLLKARAWPTDPDEARREQDRHVGLVRTLLRQIERLIELANMLLDVSRIQAGRFAVEPMELDAAQALRELVQGRLEFLASDAGVEFEAYVPDQLTSKLDPLRFDELVTNLVMNAIRTSPEGGEVKLEVGRAAQMGERSSELVLRVRDQGAILTAVERQRAFEPFESASGKRGGLGLGLYLSRQIARLHGGDVSYVEDESGKRGNLIEARFPHALTGREPGTPP